MRQIKTFYKSFLICIEILFLFFILYGRVYAGCYCDDGDTPGGLAIVCNSCSGGSAWDCYLSITGCPGGGGSFTAETKIATPSGEKEIQDIKKGDIVKSFNPETGEIKEATVTDVHKRQVSGYYILKTESGREIKVTGEHPVLALKQGNGQFSSTNFQSIFNFQIINDFFEGVWEKIRSLL